MQVTLQSADPNGDNVLAPIIPGLFTLTPTGCCEGASTVCQQDVPTYDPNIPTTVDDCSNAAQCTTNPGITVTDLEPHVINGPNEAYTWPPATISEAQSAVTPAGVKLGYPAG